MTLKIYRHIDKIRDSLDAERAAGKRIAFVPTMGNLHEGHLQLVRLAAQQCEIVVASIFVNPLQFGLNEDWDQYPRTFESDCEKLQAEKCDYLFCPTDIEMYPNGMADQTRVVCPTMTDRLCGASRPGHFEGVTTVVTKLTHIVEPDIAVYGEKDYQQLAIIRRMSADLCMGVEIIGAPIARDSDGLALSSRNSYIEPEERGKVTVLYETLQWMREAIKSGRRDYVELQSQARQRIENVGFKPDYVEVCNAQSLLPAVDDDTELAILGALFTSHARLIDNIAMTLD